MFQHQTRDVRVSKLKVIFDERLQLFFVFAAINCFQHNHFHVAPTRKNGVRVPDIGDTATHTCRKVASSRTKNDDTPPRHIFTAVIAYAFDYGVCTAVAYGKALGGEPAKIALAAGCAV